MDPRASIFDAVRAKARPGLFNDPGNILALDSLLDTFDVPRAVAATRQINGSGLAIIKRYEGLELKAYKCPADVWTIGYGSTVGVVPGMVITEAEAEERLRRDLARFEKAVAKFCPVATDNQFSAMVSLAFNIGEGAFGSSTLRRLHSAGDYAGAKAQFARWNRAGGRVLQGLVRRRATEAELYGRSE